MYCTLEKRRERKGKLVALGPTTPIFSGGGGERSLRTESNRADAELKCNNKIEERKNKNKKIISFFKKIVRYIV